MTCGELRSALRARAADPLAGPAGSRLLAHLEACPTCRGAALAQDPSLLVALSAAAEKRSAGHPDQVDQADRVERVGRAEPVELSDRDETRLSETGLSEDDASAWWQAAAEPGDAPQPDWTGFNERVLAAIAEDDRRLGVAGRLLDRGVLSPRRLTAAAGIAAALALATLAGWQGWLKTLPPQSDLVAQAPERTPDQPIDAGETPRSPGIAPVVPGLPSGIAPATLFAPPPLESIASPTARVVHLALGEAPSGPTAEGSEQSDVVLILDETMDL